MTLADNQPALEQGQIWETPDGDRIEIIKHGGLRRPRAKIRVTQPNGATWDKLQPLRNSHLPYVVRLVGHATDQ